MNRVFLKRRTNINEEGLKQRKRSTKAAVDIDDDGFADDYDIDLQQADSIGIQDDVNQSKSPTPGGGKAE